MSAAPTPGELVAALSEHPHLPALAKFVRHAALDAAAARQSEFASRRHDGTTWPLTTPLEGLMPADTDTAYGNVFSILERGVATPTEALLLGALLALSAREEPESEDQEVAFVAHVTWLATHTPCDALLCIDAAAGEHEGLWRALARVALEPAQVASDFGRTEALVAAAALGASTSEIAAPVRARAVNRAHDAPVRALLAAGRASQEPLKGELQPAPFSAVTTAILTLTLVLFVWQGARLIGRLAFAYRRPAALTLTQRGLELTHHVELLGKV
ncbi:MAG TPA: hypothetical protein VGK73_01545, partial [Polyangiaceae bacterium]